MESREHSAEATPSSLESPLLESLRTETSGSRSNSDQQPAGDSRNNPASHKSALLIPTQHDEAAPSDMEDGAAGATPGFSHGSSLHEGPGGVPGFSYRGGTSSELVVPSFTHRSLPHPHKSLVASVARYRLELWKSFLAIRTPWPVSPFRQIELIRKHQKEALEEEQRAEELAKDNESQNRWLVVPVELNVWLGCIWAVAVRAGMIYAVIGMAENFGLSPMFDYSVTVPGGLGLLAALASLWPFLSSKFDFEKRGCKDWDSSHIRFAGRIAGTFVTFWLAAGIFVSVMWMRMEHRADRHNDMP